MRTTTEAVDCPSGAICEMRPSAPSAPATEVRPSSSGTTAATSAPKATMRMISVIGSETSSAWLRSWLTTWLTAWPPEASPASWSVVPGCEARDRGHDPLERRRRARRRCRGRRAAAPARAAACPPARDRAGMLRGPWTEATLGRCRARISSAVTAAPVLRALPELTSTLSVAGDVEVGGGQRGVGPSRFAGARARVGEGLGTGGGAGEDAAGDQDQPQGDDGPRVARRSAGDRAHRPGQTPRRLTRRWDTTRGFLMLASLPTGRSAVAGGRRRMRRGAPPSRRWG